MTDESMSYLEALREIKRLKEAVGKIKEEIENLKYHEHTATLTEKYKVVGIVIECMVNREDVLEIIDKHTEGLI